MKLISKRWTRNIKKSIALLLSCITLLMLPLNAYASATFVASSSNLETHSGSVEGEYMPDNIVTRYEQSLEKYPLTLNRIRQNRSVVATVGYVLVIILSALGVYVSSDVALDVFDGFDSYLRRGHGNNSIAMGAWQSILSSVSLAKIVGMTVLFPIIKLYLQDTLTGYGTNSPDYAFSTGAGVIKDGPFHPDMIKTMDEYGSHRYLASFPLMDNSNVVYDSFCTLTVMDKPMIAFYVSTGGLLSIVFIDDRDKISFNNPHFYSRTYVPSDLSYKYSNGAIFSYNSNCYKPFLANVNYSLDDRMQFMANCLPYPLFKDMDYARSYAQYGTMDGVISPDPDYVFTPKKVWTGLQQGALDRFGDTLTIPTEEEWLTLQDRLSSSATADDVLGALDGVFDIQGTITPPIIPPLSPSVAYSNLSYVITVLAGYCGAVLTEGQIDNFIEYHSGVTVGSLDKEALLKNANIIVHNSIVINGGKPDPDDNNGNNSYKVLKSLAVSLGAFLIGLGLFSDSPDFNNSPVINNVHVVDELPEIPSNPDSGDNVDLSGILGWLKKIFDVLNPWSNPLALINEMVLKFGFTGLFDSLKNTIILLPKLISDELSLSGLFENIANSIYLLPSRIADEVNNSLGLIEALEGLELNKLFNNVIDLLPDALINGLALPSLFNDIEIVIGSIPESIAELFGIVSTFSLPTILMDIYDSLKTLPQRIKDIIPPPPVVDTGVEDGEEGGFKKFLIALIALLLILVLLFILFLNLLIFIVSIFSIPASTALLNENVIAGLEFLKSVQLPLFSLSIYELIMGCVYFVVFMSIVSMLRKQINHIRVKG